MPTPKKKTKPTKLKDLKSKDVSSAKAGKVEGRMVLDFSQSAKTRPETGELAHA